MSQQTYQLCNSTGTGITLSKKKIYTLPKNVKLLNIYRISFYKLALLQGNKIQKHYTMLSLRFFFFTALHLERVCFEHKCGLFYI